MLFTIVQCSYLYLKSCRNYNSTMVIIYAVIKDCLKVINRRNLIQNTSTLNLPVCRDREQTQSLQMLFGAKISVASAASHA